VRRHKWIGIIDDSPPIQNGSRRGPMNESMIQIFESIADSAETLQDQIRISQG
jgi:hypothetical protein